jgi:hypothetical protein
MSQVLPATSIGLVAAQRPLAIIGYSGLTAKAIRISAAEAAGGFGDLRFGGSRTESGRLCLALRDSG